MLTATISRIGDRPIPSKTNKAFGEYKSTYLSFLRAIQQTQLVSAVAEYSLRNFPKGLPPSAAKAAKLLFNQVGSALASVASRVAAKETDSNLNENPPHPTVPTKPKISRRQTNTEASKIAFDALKLMLALDLKRPGSRLLKLGSQFQIMARHQAVAMFYAHLDAFFGDTLRVICRARPEVLRSGRQLTWETALGFEDMDDLVETLAEQFIYEFGWKTLADRLKFFSDKFGVDLAIPADQLELLTLFEQRRHLIIHNGGVVSAKYIADTGDTHASIGQQISISRDEVRSLGHAAAMLGSELCATVGVQFLGAKPSDLTQIWRGTQGDQKSTVG